MLKIYSAVGPAASTSPSPGSLLEMQISGPTLSLPHRNSATCALRKLQEIVIQAKL